MELTEVLHGEHRLERSDGTLQELCGGSCEDDVVDVEEQVDHFVTATEDEQRSVGLYLHKPQGQ